MELRVEVESECNQSLKSKVIDSQTENADIAYRVCKKLLIKIEESVDMLKSGDCTSIKQITNSLKDLQELGVFGDTSQSSEITIKFADEVDDYGC